MPKNSFLKPSLKTSLLIIAIIIAASAVFAPFLLIFNLLAPIIAEGFPFFIFYLLAFGGSSAAIYFIYKHRGIFTNPRWVVKDYMLFIWIGLGAIMIQQGLVIPLISLIPVPEFLESFLYVSVNYDIWYYITFILLAPVFEEFIFRESMLKELFKDYSPWKAIAISAALFGFIHLNPWQFVAAFAIGMFAGWIYYRTRNLTLAIVVHIAHNAYAISPPILAQPDYEGKMSLLDKYGGQADILAAIIVGSLLIAALCIYILQRKFDRMDKERNEEAALAAQMQESVMPPTLEDITNTNNE